MSNVPTPPTQQPGAHAAVPSPQQANLPSVQMPADLPAYVQQYSDQSAEAGSLITGNLSLPSISIQGKQFSYDETVLNMGVPIEVVILANDPPEGVAKAYYAKAFNPSANDAPDCSSTNGKTPDAFVASPISPTCAVCQFNQFGSGVAEDGRTPTKGKRCSDFKNLFVVFPHNVNGEIYVLRVPATSLKALSQFGRKIVEKAVPMQALVVQISFANNVVHPQLEFNAVRWLDQGSLQIAMERSKSEALLSMLPSRYAPTPTQAATAAADNLLPPPDTNVHHMTEKAGATTYEAFIQSGWSDQQLIEQGYMHPPKTDVPPPSSTPPPPTSEPVQHQPQKVMTAKAGGSTYQDFVNQGWSDEQLISNGYMEVK